MGKVLEIRVMVWSQLSDAQFDSTVSRTLWFIGQDAFRVVCLRSSVISSGRGAIAQFLWSIDQNQNASSSST